MATPKHIGIIVAGGMPPPGKLRKSMGSEGGDSEDMDEGETGAGQVAFDDMMSAMDRGDRKAAYRAFMEAVRACAVEGGGESEDFAA